MRHGLLPYRAAVAGLCLLVLPAPAPAQRNVSAGAPLSQENEPEWHPFFGVSIAAGGIPGPFAMTCLGPGAAATGIDGYAGVRSGGGWDLQLHVSIFEKNENQPICGPRLRPSDGTVQRKTYAEEFLRLDALRTVGVHAGYVPPFVPFLRVSAGAGIDWDEQSPYLAGGLDLRFGSERFHVVAGGQYFIVHVPYGITEFEFRNRELVRSERIGGGYEWNDGLTLRLGIEMMSIEHF